MSGILQVLTIVFICATTATGQSTFGGIAGTIHDPGGGGVPFAAVRARAVETGVVTASVSSRMGLYEFASLKPGRYIVTAGKAGFSDSEAVEVAIQARRTIFADLILQFKVAKEVLTVRQVQAAVETADGVVVDTKAAAQVGRLPLNFRALTTSPTSVLSAVPGVQHDRVGKPSVGGGLPAQLEYTIDGISSINVRFSGPNLVSYPSPESIEELKVTSIGAGAEFGAMGDVTLVTRGGTNQLHGSAFWYHQNAALDAKTYGAPAKQAKVYNTFGSSLGGPLQLFKYYRGRNRTFFFADFEINHKPASNLLQFSAPTQQMRRGDLDNLPGGAVLDPLGGASFAANRIPLSRINPVAEKLLRGYVPLPNYDNGSTFNNYRVLFASPTRADAFDTRLDHWFGSRNQLYARWNWRDTNERFTNGFLPPSQWSNRSRNVLISHNFIVRPNLLMESRVGLSRWTGTERFSIRAVDAIESLGLQGVDRSRLVGVQGFPIFYTSGTGFTSLGRGRDGPESSRNAQVAENVTWIQGRHTAKFGMDLRAIGSGAVLHLDGDDVGIFAFEQGAFSGNAFADLLLGLPAETSYGAIGPNLDSGAFDTHLYVQDRWRVNSRLSLTFGLRWQVHPAMQESAGNLTNFDRRTGSVIVPDRTTPPAAGFLTAVNACPGLSAEFPCTPIVTASAAGLPEGLRRTRFKDFSPRFGFAFRPRAVDTTVVRGSFGFFTQTALGQVAYANVGIHTSDVRTFSNFEGPGIPPKFALPQAHGGAAALDNPGNATFNTAIDPTFREPRSYQWSLTVEQSLKAKVSVRLSYVGIESVGLANLVDLNQIAASTTPFANSRKPYPGWGQVFSLENIGFANYQGLQAVLSRQFSDGVYFQASYLLSKNVGNGAGPVGGRLQFPSEYFPRVITDRFNTRLDRGNLAGSRQHRFVLTGLFALPVGKGRTFGRRMGRFADLAIGGWEVSTVAMLESGQYVTPTIGGRFDQSNTNAAARGALSRPDRVGDGNLDNPARDRFFDIAAFKQTPAGAGRFGNAGVGILRGPGAAAVAAGLSKTIALSEKVRVRIEATFTNLPNHPNFVAPSVDVSTPSSFGKLSEVQAAENSGNRTGQIGIRIEF